MKSPYTFKLSLFAAGIALIIGSVFLPATTSKTFAVSLVDTRTPTIVPPAATPQPELPPVYVNPYIIKTCDGKETMPGQDTSFTIVAGNRGTASAVNVQVRDTLPAYVTLKSVTASPRGTVIINGNSFIVDIGTLDVNELITIKIVGTLNANAAPGAGINVATLNTTSNGDNPNDNISMCTYPIGAIISPPTGTDLSFLPLLMMAMGALLILGSLFIRQRPVSSQN